MSAATYPVATIAKLLLLTERRVQQLTSDGVLPKGERGRYELAPVVQSYIRYLRDRALPGQVEVASNDFHKARARRTAAEACLAEMRAAEMKGELIPAHDVRAVLASVVARIRSKLIGLPPKLSPLVVGSTSLSEVEGRIREGVHEALEELAGTQVAGVKADGTAADPDSQ